MVRQLQVVWLWSMQSIHFCINGFISMAVPRVTRSEPSPTMLMSGEANSGTVCLLSLVFCKCVLSGQTICSQLIVGFPTHLLLVKFPDCSCFTAHNLGKFVSIWVKRVTLSCAVPGWGWIMCCWSWWLLCSLPGSVSYSLLWVLSLFSVLLNLPVSDSCLKMHFKCQTFFVF